MTIEPRPMALLLKTSREQMTLGVVLILIEAKACFICARMEPDISLAICGVQKPLLLDSVPSE